VLRFVREGERVLLLTLRQNEEIEIFENSAAFGISERSRRCGRKRSKKD
jgi:hypothetical protein